jgi:formate-dependent nitrite reductase membrane component NrfD
MSFGSLSAALAAAQFASDHGRSPSRTIRTVIKLLEAPAALSGMAMSTYTGALLSATSTPLWAAAPRRIAAVFGASAMASGAAALTIAAQGHRTSDAGRALDRIALAASALELFLLLSLRQRFREQGVDGALNETGWGLAYDLGAVALGAGVPVLHHVESIIELKQPRRAALVISLAVLAGGFLLRHVLMRAGNVSAKRPKDYFRLTGRVPQ